MLGETKNVNNRIIFHHLTLSPEEEKTVYSLLKKKKDVTVAFFDVFLYLFIYLLLLFLTGCRGGEAEGERVHTTIPVPA